MAKKSKAQIKRLIERAAARGEVYVPPPEAENQLKGEGEANEASAKDEAGSEMVEDTKDSPDDARMAAAIQLKKELDEIAANEGLKAKERRSAKRKAEAIATEASGVDSEELLAWYEAQSGPDTKQDESKAKGTKPIPYIVFIGQLSYDTTKEEIFQHIQEQLGDDHKITNKTVQIRLLTDARTKKSRGMAFVEVPDPEMLYSCLKMHHTMLKGRRINVERSAGGGRNSENRKSKLTGYRQEQEQHVETAVKSMLEEYYKSGEMKEGELDAVALEVSKRHSAAIVQATLERYVDSNGRDMDNPSAYFTYLLGKLATEGIYVTENYERKQQGATVPRKQKTTASQESPRKQPKQQHTRDPSLLSKSSELAKQGVDMSSSRAKPGTDDLHSIFPSMGRGRGRGRGYL